MTPPDPPRWRIAHSEASLGWGGQEHRVLAELVGFQQRGAQTSLLAPATSAIAARARDAGIPVEFLRAGRLRFPWAVWQVAAWLRTQRTQIVNTHSSQDGWIAGLAARLARTPLVIRTRHIDVDYPRPWLSRHAFTTLADHVLTTSNKITAHFQLTFRLPPTRISTVPTGIDVQRFSPEGPAAALIPRGPSPPPPLIGMVSVLRSWKGHPLFLEAAQQLVAAGVPAHFVIVGDGPQRAAILERVAAMGLGGAVTLTGHREDVPSVLRALRVLVIASTRHEGIPQVGLQALACLTPVVASDAGGTPEIIRPGETGRLVPSGDATALAAAIRAALEQPEETASLARRGREFVLAEHSLDRMFERLEAIYRRALGAEPG